MVHHAMTADFLFMKYTNAPAVKNMSMLYMAGGTDMTELFSTASAM